LAAFYQQENKQLHKLVHEQNCCLTCCKSKEKLSAQIALLAAERKTTEKEHRSLREETLACDKSLPRNLRIAPQQNLSAGTSKPLPTTLLCTRIG
jgi:hypothetical protein